MKFVAVYISFIIIFCLATDPDLYAQTSLCNGNPGENIFTSGSFGSGSLNVLPTNPGLAPGFNYTTQVPPDDGEYTITNGMQNWQNTFPTWLRIGDNSSDPNGYMMVVNASFNPGIFYEQVIDNLCAFTLYEFSADIINLIRNGVTGHILPNVSFLLDDVEIYNTGSIAQDEDWHTFGFTFQTSAGQTSVKLTLKNNAPGGIGNDLAIDNISFRACGPESSISISPEGKICENTLFPILTAHIDADTGALLWQLNIGQGWTDIAGATDRTYQINELTAGIYLFRYVYSSSVINLSNPKCRIISDTISVEIVPVSFSISDSICEGMIYEFGIEELTVSGDYQQLLTASNGCDSLVMLHLEVFPDPPIVAEFGFTIPSCEGAADGSISVISVDGTRPPFIFRINDSIIPPPGTTVDLMAGTYTAWIENEYGCFDKEEITIPDGPPLDINTIEDVNIILGHSVLLETTASLPVTIIYWTPPEGLNCTGCLVPLATPFQDQTYVINATTDKGCADMDSITIRVDPDPVIYIPNVFSPNNDGINDFFEVFLDPLNIRTVDIVTIFDRWGGIISEKTTLFNEGRIKLWDGATPKGLANPGTYVYLITFTTADGKQRSVSGDVTVLK